ncbi:MULTISPECIES: MmgE/PrpD family protein [Mesorhizobium]|uniref:MmgE/PrpD family protein n=1 Tax=Mesorhizobium huakuii TaxID=28104 RepID=A0ABZ0VKU2_9HYPH|nr:MULTISPECIES: MmgE/PrpD family protein [Mesorhizobium]WQB96959.1 MmgE/PrpD family protein [Mesorhizobium huakuii]
MWLIDEHSSVVGAAMANSAAARALDIDEGHRGAEGHAGAGVIPAAWEWASTSETMAAIALGYKSPCVWQALGLRKQSIHMPLGAG